MVVVEYIELEVFAETAVGCGDDKYLLAAKRCNCVTLLFLCGELYACCVVGAVARRVLFKVVLVVGFCRPEFCKRFDFGRDGAVACFGQEFLVVYFCFECCFFLFRRGVVNGASVIVAYIVSLTVFLCGVVHFPERFDEFLRGYFAVIVDYLDRLCMVDDAFGSMVPVFENGMVVRVVVVAAGIAGDSFDDTGHLLKVFFNTPEAAGCKDNDLRLGKEGDGKGKKEYGYFHRFVPLEWIAEV